MCLLSINLMIVLLFDQINIIFYAYLEGKKRRLSLSKFCPPTLPSVLGGNFEISYIKGNVQRKSKFFQICLFVMFLGHSLWLSVCPSIFCPLPHRQTCNIFNVTLFGLKLYSEVQVAARCCTKMYQLV